MSWLPAPLLILHLAVFVAVMLRILARRTTPGVAMAWLLFVLLVPVAGITLYVMVGERRLGRRWIERAEAEREALSRRYVSLSAASGLAPEAVGPMGAQVARLAQSLVGIPPMRGHAVTLLSSSDRILRSMIDDVEACQTRCVLEFYIWHEGGLVDALIDGLKRAARRGVRVRALMDGLGSRPFVMRGAIGPMRDAGIEVVVVLPASALRMLVARADLRDHRKIAVFDDRVAYTGSFNLADPRHFKREAGVGEWIDAMVRVQGPASALLASISDTMARLQMGARLRDARPEAGASGPLPAEGPPAVRERVTDAGDVKLQPFPSGPGFAFHHVESVVLTAIYAARREIVLTTPYFAPGESVVTALRSAAHRGVAVTLVVPRHCDSRLVQFASASYFDELLAAGVQIQRFDGGLLHTKSLVIDREMSVFGTVNFDLRSFHLNFELSLLVYDRAFAAELLALQQRYLLDCEPLDLGPWRGRPFWRRVVENAAQLASPLL